jgi:hypothetical protein
MNLRGAEMSAIRERSQSGLFPAKADTGWQASPAGSVENDSFRKSDEAIDAQHWTTGYNELAAILGLRA